MFSKCLAHHIRKTRKHNFFSPFRLCGRLIIKAKEVLNVIQKGFHSRCVLWFASGMSAKILMHLEAGLLEGGWITGARTHRWISPLVSSAAEGAVRWGPVRGGSLVV